MHPGRTVLVLSAFLATAACGNWVGEVGPAAGSTGVSVTSDGHVLVNVYVCRDTIDEIAIFGDRQGLKETEENKVVATYKSAKPLTGTATLDLAAPGDAWSPSEPLELEPGKGYIISAQGTGDDANETVAVYLSADGIGELEPGAIYTADQNDSGSTALTINTPAEFEALAKTACSD